MDWGNLLEPIVLREAAKDLKFEIKPNAGATESRSISGMAYWVAQGTPKSSVRHAAQAPAK
jgi:hypothetical protein